MFLCFYLQFSGLKARHTVVLIRLVIKVISNDVCLTKSPGSILDGLRTIIGLAWGDCVVGRNCAASGVAGGSSWFGHNSDRVLRPLFCCLHGYIL